MPSIPAPPSIHSKPGGRSRMVLGLAISIAGAVMALLGRRQFLGYDSYWHVFIASQPDWASFLAEVRSEAHPPLFYWLLSLAADSFGRHPLSYRVVGILATLGSLLWLVWITRRLAGGSALPVLVGVAFGFSAVVWELAMEVRPYALCVSLVLLAFLGYLEWIRSSPRRLAGRWRALFSISMTLAIVTHYSAALAFFGMVGSLPLLAVLARRWRLRLWYEAARYPGAWAAMFAPPAVVGLLAYVVHASQWGAGRLNHVPGFMFDPLRESAAHFLARNTQNLMALFLPFGLSTWPGGRLLAVACLAPVALALLGSRRDRSRTGAIPLVVLLLMVSINALLGLAGKYPYGGRLRHEYFLFPFGLLVLAVTVEAIRRALPPRGIRSPGLDTTLAFAIAASVAYSASGFKVSAEPVTGDQLLRFPWKIGLPDALYTDQFNLIVVFSRYHDWTWTIHASSPDGSLRQVWRVSRDGQRFFVCRDREWQLNLDEASLYRNVASCLSAAGASSVAIFRPQQLGFHPAWPTAETSRLVADHAATAGLIATRIDVNGEDVYASFVASPGSNGASEAARSHGDGSRRLAPSVGPRQSVPSAAGPEPSRP